jgi:hypothetical protein
MRSLYRILSFTGDVKAASRGTGSFVRRKVRSAAHRQLAKGLRRALRP